MVILSIDSKNKEAVIIKTPIKSDKKDVRTFLEELNGVLQSEEFDISRDFFLNSGVKDKYEFSTEYTLLDLEYDSFDVIESLKELSVNEYSETLVDRDDENPPLLFVFGKEINGRQIYIKLKVKGETRKRIVCISFHYAEYKMEFPYNI